MDNFELHQEAMQLADSHSAYMLARMLLIEQKDRIELAAHVERLRDAGKAIRHELAQWALTEQDPETSAAMCQFDHVARETPTTSLARRDAKSVYDAVYTATVIMNSLEASEYLVDLRQQAKELSDD